MSLERFIKYIKEGEPVAPGTPNRPLQQLDQNIKYLKDIIDAAHLGSTVYAREQTVESTLEVGMPVYWNTSNGRFEAAIAKTETDPFTGYVRASPASEVWGIIALKHEAKNADILLFGYAPIDIKAATDSSGVVPAGTYYLSGVNEGKLILQKPAITAPVLRADGSGNVFVNPSFVDFLDNHQHFKFDLLMEPAGTTFPPYVGFQTGGYRPDRSSPSPVNNPVVHTIGNADSSLRGWLPADDAVFEGNAPDGAKFGYNLSAEPQLDNLFPPIPLESVDVELQRPSIYDSMGSVQIDIPEAFNKTDNSGVTYSIAAGVTQSKVFSVNLLNSSGGIVGAAPEFGDTILAHTMPVGSGALVSADAGIVYKAFLWPAGSVGSAPRLEVVVTNPTTSTILFPDDGVNLRITVIKDKVNWQMMTMSKQVLDDFVKIDRYGIWWMKDCYDQVPWPTDLDSFASEDSESYPDCPSSSGSKMRLYFTKVNFATDHSVVSSLTSVDSRIKVYCAGSTTTEAVGDLDIDLDFSFATTEATAGFEVLKSLDSETSIITRGPVTEGIYATTPGTVILVSDNIAAEAKVVDGVNQAVYQGIVGIGLTTEPSQILAAQLVRLDGVTEEHTPLLYLGMNHEYSTSYVVKFEVPSDAPSYSFLSFRLRMIGRVDGIFPKLSIKYEAAKEPSEAPATGTGYKRTTIAVPNVTGGIIDTTTGYDAQAPNEQSFGILSQYGTMMTAAQVSVANESILTSDLAYLGHPSDAATKGVGFGVNPGDIVYITVSRIISSDQLDNYVGELGIIAQTAVLNRPVSESPWYPTTV